MLGITMRQACEIYDSGQRETRDCLAADWPLFFRRVLAGSPWVMLPNLGPDVIAYAAMLGVKRLIFSGGPDWGRHPERDATEKALFAWAAELAIQVLGICRGAQVINRLMGGSDRPTAGHVGICHQIILKRGGEPARACVANSFHARAIAPADLAPGLAPFAFSSDGNVEAFKSPDGRLVGVMWHPERPGCERCLEELFLQDFAWER